MEELFTKTVSSPVGFLVLTGTHQFLQSIHFSEIPGDDSTFIPEILLKTEKQLQEYFGGKRREFELKLAPEGSDFQKKVWNLVYQVRFGETLSYLDIAKLSGSEKNTRAVGLANGKNPIPIVIPCHRIVGSNGKLTGYSGGLERKRWLLRHEQKFSPNEHLLF